jgi:hypothetical protein
MKCSFLSGKQTLYSRPKNIINATSSFEVREYCKSKRPQFYILCPKSPKPVTENTSRQNIKGLRPTKQERKIAEAIILQAVEDLWSPVYRKESVDFFTGEGFVICARIVGMGLYQKLRLIQLIKKAIQKKDYSYPKQFLKQAWG